MLREHQLEVVRKAIPIIVNHDVVYLAVEMRVGKTLMALEIARQFGVRNLLWVTPKSAIASIEADFEAMGSPPYDLEVINRESLHKVRNSAYDMIVMDEAHRDGGYPKPNKGAKAVRAIERGKTIILTGTPSVESGAQLFHQFWTTGAGPWQEYKNFYGWHKKNGVRKTRRIAGGQEINDYSEVKPNVLEDIKPYVVSMTQSEAGFQHQAEVIPVFVEDRDALRWCDRFDRDGVAYVDGRNIVGDTPASALQKAHMYIGGTLIDEDGEVLIAREEPPKLETLRKRLARDAQYFISTAYIAERCLISSYLEAYGFRVFREYEAFTALKGTDHPGILIGSGISLSEGVDLSWMTGSMIIYSQNWSGAKWLQLIERQNNWARDRPVKINVLIARNSIDQMVFDAVQGKRTFNIHMYKRMRYR